VVDEGPFDSAREAFVRGRSIGDLENPPSGLIDNLLLMSWVFIFTFILWVFKFLKGIESRRRVTPGDGVKR
jgi:hypothetical protein